MKIFWNLLPIAIVSVFAFPMQVRAGMLTSDPNAMPAWQGSVSFFDNFYPGYTLDGVLDYAVYSPGSSFVNSFGAGTDPSGGANYVYAYQINSINSLDSITRMTVGLDGNELPAFPTYVEPVPANSNTVKPNMPPPANPCELIVGSAPSIYTSSSWQFVMTRIGKGKSSKILIFTSPFGPESDSVSIQGSHASAWTGSVPSPVPEPASLFSLLAFGGLSLVYRALRKR